MHKKEELVKSNEYWLEIIQNELYFELNTYMQDKGFTKSELSKELGFSKKFISKVLKGDFNHSVKKLIKLLLAIGKVPKFDFIPISDLYKQ